MSKINSRLPLCWGLVFLALTICLAQPGNGQSARISSSLVLSVRNGFTETGSITGEWKEAIHNRHTEESLQAVASTERNITEQESEWMRLVNENVQVWKGMVDSLRIPFKDISPPDTVVILLGHQGGNDAFVFAPSTICFDLSQLQAEYGNAMGEGNRERLNRFFAHEFTHVLHKSWARKNHLQLRTPFELALWECLTEGLGNYRSLFSRWVNEEGELTDHALSTLSKLQPIFVERLSALEHASANEATPLLQGLSMGRFDEKWGALTVALWLVRETQWNDRNLGKWVEKGPYGVLELGRIHLPEELQGKMPKSHH